MSMFVAALPLFVAQSANDFSLDLQYARVNGFVQVREQDHPGTRLPLHDLGIDDGEIAALQYVRALGDESRLRCRARFFYVAGTSTSPDEVEFNGVRYEAGTSIHANAQLTDFSFHWERDLFHFGDGGSVSFLGGATLTWLAFKMHGSEAADTHSHDEQEAFWKQALPFPSLGLRVAYPLSSTQSLFAEAYGFRAIHWNTWRSEGGEVYLSQDNFEATGGWSWRFDPKWELTAGVRFDYTSIDEQSREDGNVILMRSFGPFVALSVRF